MRSMTTVLIGATLACTATWARADAEPKGTDDGWRPIFVEELDELWQVNGPYRIEDGVLIVGGDSALVTLRLVPPVGRGLNVRFEARGLGPLPVQLRVQHCHRWGLGSGSYSFGLGAADPSRPSWWEVEVLDDVHAEMVSITLRDLDNADPDSAGMASHGIGSSDYVNEVSFSIPAGSRLEIRKGRVHLGVVDRNDASPWIVVVIGLVLLTYLGLHLWLRYRRKARSFEVGLDDVVPPNPHGPTIA